jgi:hypothetical protein
MKTMNDLFSLSKSQVRTYHLHCTCGASWRGTMPEHIAADIIRMWQKEHSGEGHRPTDAKTQALSLASKQDKLSGK